MGQSTEEKRALSTQNQANAQSLSAYGIAAPQYARLAQGNYGYTPQQMANMNTASLQSLGGATAGAYGLGNLEAARTGNVGGFNSGIAAAARGADQQLSQNALDVQNQNAQLQQQNMRFGLQGESNLYDNASRIGLEALSDANTAASRGTARNLGWANFGLNLLRP